MLFSSLFQSQLFTIYKKVYKSAHCTACLLKIYKKPTSWVMLRENTRTEQDSTHVVNNTGSMHNWYEVNTNSYWR